MRTTTGVVHSDPEVLGGVTVFRGTRVPVRVLFEFLAAGDSLDEFLDAYPSVTREQATAVLSDRRGGRVPGCVLRLTGPHAELEDALRGAFVGFEESRQTELERERGKRTAADDSTFNHTVSEADGGHVPQQIHDAEAFVARHIDALTDLIARPAVAHAVLDFGWTIASESFGSWNRFPASLLTLCARAGIDIEVSVYVVDTGASDS